MNSFPFFVTHVFLSVVKNPISSYELQIHESLRGGALVNPFILLNINSHLSKADAKTPRMDALVRNEMMREEMAR